VRIKKAPNERSVTRSVLNIQKVMLKRLLNAEGKYVK